MACFVGGLPAGLRLCNGTDLLRGTACLLVGASLSLRCHPRLLAACLLGGLPLGLRLCNGTDLLRHTTCLFVGASLLLRCHPRLLAAGLLAGLPLGLRLYNRTDLLRHTACVLVGASLLLRCDAGLLGLAKRLILRPLPSQCVRNRTGVLQCACRILGFPLSLRGPRRKDFLDRAKSLLLGSQPGLVLRRDARFLLGGRSGWGADR